jgi:uncharacterized protein (TIGR03435 family)
LAGIVVALLAGPSAVRVRAQNPRVAFEVASIKPNKSGSGSSSINTNAGSLRASNVTLRRLITRSYRLLDFQVIGGPDWIGTERFDIEARAEAGAMPPPGTADSVARENIMAGMIQSLLEERFQLKSHREMRELPVFALTLGKDGSKLQSTVEGRPGPGGITNGSTHTNGTAAGVEMSGSGVSIDRLVGLLASQVGRPIIDKTNLAGTYDFSLKFAPPQPTSVAAGANADSATEPVGPSLFTAIQEQLGLKLESTKGPVEVLVIDSVQKPTEN